ncbi:probable flavin-containing monooxygenase 1 [Solanum dulcamara]|uniref:probable flavin-containing monooxygenase 1 n=1 Tax=Solanum dulcamara TaxID=45834 RepID=UPI0024853597|nr:probable flavin-containing monooxygenase 1 [Solanum dulcamara]
MADFNVRESRKKEVIAIIGAGISGLLACKYAISKGFDPIVFESESSIGGVWTKTIGSTKLQTPKPFYQFSDFPWPDSVTEMFPDQQTVLEYIESYASHFNLVRHIQFNSKVLSLSYEDGEPISGDHWNVWGDAFGSRGKWNVNVQDTPTLSTKVYQVDFVIVCVGKFSQVPNIPEFPWKKGPEAFEGQVIHSMDYSKMDSKTAANFVKGKHVAIVGFQKSGMDIAMECAMVNGVERPCTVVIRTPHWHLPDFFPWGLSLGYLYLSRFSQLTMHKPGEGLLLSLLATTLSPLRWAFSKFVESYIKHKHRLAKHGMLPAHSFLNELSSCTLAIVPEGFYDRVEEGSIKLVKKEETVGFSKEGIMLKGHAELIKSDLVILATGFKGIDKLKHIFESSKYQEFIGGLDDSAAVPLYRECIHPGIPQVAIIGFSETITNLFTSEMRCRWLAELLDGKFKLPSIKVMEKDIAEWDKYKKRYSYRKYYRRSCIAALHVWHNDQICKDMGWNPKRKKGFWAEWFQPYGPMDYT